MSNKDKISRRDFLKVAGIGTAVVSTSSLLSSCSAKPAGVPDKWDGEYDVIVLGSGTGILAAVRAAESGLSTLVLEKAPVVGGTTAISGGGIAAPNNYVMQKMGIEDSREEALEYYIAASFGQGDPELLEIYIDTVLEALDYMRNNGLENWMNIGMFQDYYGNLPGMKATGRSILPVSTMEDVGSGPFLIQTLKKSAEGYGAEIKVSTPAKSLITNEDGEVIGVVAENKGVEMVYKANLGVLVATGGFDHDEAMTRNFLRGPIYFSSAVATNTGDGHKMAMKIGAGLANMNECWGLPGYYHEDYQTWLGDWVLERGKPGAIIVNREGNRFMNESAAYDPSIRPFYYWDTGSYEYKNIPGFTIVDSAYRERYSLLYTPVGTDLPDFIARADTLADLAEKLGIDPEGLENTVAEFNTYAEEGVDPDFHRGEYPLDQSTGGDLTRTDLPNICMAPLTKPPFYGISIMPGTIGTCGGMKINKDAQVYDSFGEIIPGLYACGNACASPFGAGYATGGCTIGSGLVFGYRAAIQMGSKKE